MGKMQAGEIYDASHALDTDERMTGDLKPGNVSIGRRVWIGRGTVIRPDVSIGDDSVIGAGSVVTHDIPSGVVTVDNPCRVLRPITPADKFGYKPRTSPKM